jgi:LysM repeat protein
VTLTVIGAPDIAATEKAIRSHGAVHQRQRSVHSQHAKAASQLKLPEPTYPRFVRIHSPRSTESSLMLVWPAIRHNERYELGLRQIASLIEQRLYRAWGPHAERRATVRLHWSGIEGILGIEVLPTHPGDLASTEERVFAVLDQLRSAPVSSPELNSLLVDVNTRQPLTGDLDLDQALHMAQKSLFSWNPRVMVKTSEAYPTPAELQQWIREAFSRLNVTEVFSEAPAPVQQAAVPVHSQSPRGFAYTVKAGESLQMIAHKFRVTISDLIRINHLPHPDQIAPGTRLTIPSSPRATPAN